MGDSGIIQSFMLYDVICKICIGKVVEAHDADISLMAF